ncbi:FBP domain-containing protein [Paramicrobacterium agarici]|uniref:FBP domain-containing protein n=1 Tax=Paramicrobacterium agarici TaxID=630514 RepID=UPI001151A892|nr:FBP domain-containing protein [Microbacterium agarici]TQO21967.1 treble-clef zinc-finger protein [Microbacterium agarici]
MKQLTPDDIVSSFVNATPEQLERLPLPGLHETMWDEREYLGWRDPQAARLGYIVHWADGRPVGIVVRAASGGLNRGIAAMCSFCRSSQPATQVRMFSAPRAGEAGLNGNTIGTYICEDLACSMLIRITPSQPLQPDLVETRSQRLLERVQGFTADVLKTA